MTFKIHTIMASDGAAAMITPGLSEMSEHAGREEIKIVVAGHLGPAIKAGKLLQGPPGGSLPGGGRSGSGCRGAELGAAGWPAFLVAPWSAPSPGGHPRRPPASVHAVNRTHLPNYPFAFACGVSLQSIAPIDRAG